MRLVKVRNLAKENMADRQKNYKLSLRIYKLNLSIYKLRLRIYILRLSIENFMRWQQKKSSVKHRTLSIDCNSILKE